MRENYERRDKKSYEGEEKLMKISVITVNYNGSKTLSRTIESVLNQTYNNIEYIIIDGKSTDNSTEIIKSYEKKFKEKKYEYKWISEKDTGTYNAMNKGIKMASGKIVGIINSDDWYEKDTLNLVANEFKRDINLEMIYGLLRTINNNCFEKIKGDYHSFGKGQHPTVFLKKEIYEKYGAFNEKYKIAADSDLLLRLKNKNIKYIFIEKILANFDLSGISTRNFLEASLEDVKISYLNGIYTKKERIIRIISIYLKYFGKNLLK